MKSTIVIGTVFAALLGIGLSVEHFLNPDHNNPGYHAFPAVIGMHVAPGAIYLGLALLQFNSGIRSRFPKLHRVTGRIAVGLGVVSGVFALVVTLLFPFHGALGIYVIGPFAVLFLFSLLRGFWFAYSRNFERHREWMIRALAVATSIATMRIVFVPSLLIIGPSMEVAAWLSLVSFGVAFVIHSVAAEFWIRATRTRDLAFA